MNAQTTKLGHSFPTQENKAPGFLLNKGVSLGCYILLSTMKTNRDPRKQTHLVSCDVGHRQLGLVVEHLLKVGHMPRRICGVTMKTLRKQIMKGRERERTRDGERDSY